MLRMNSVRKKRTDKTVVKEHIVLAAAKAFAQKGVKTVRMDDIATGLSISKRTLYELFHDKEDLLLDVMKLHREEMQEYMTQVASKAENVLEVLLKFFQRSAQDFQNTNRKFFEDIEKYPKVMRYIDESRKENLDSAMEFYRKGVEMCIRDSFHAKAQAAAAHQNQHFVYRHFRITYGLQGGHIQLAL